jgi:hypothetical protein
MNGRQKDIPIPAPPRLHTPLGESRQSNKDCFNDKLVLSFVFHQRLEQKFGPPCVIAP